MEHSYEEKEKKEEQGQPPPDISEYGNFHPSYPFYSWDNIYFTLGYGEAPVEGDDGTTQVSLYLPPDVSPGQSMLPPQNAQVHFYPPAEAPPGQPMLPPPGGGELNQYPLYPMSNTAPFAPGPGIKQGSYGEPPYAGQYSDGVGTGGQQKFASNA
jgi:hypothetical protein